MTLHRQSVVEQVVGTWELTSLETRRSDGHVDQPLGPSPMGLLLYTEDGFMSAQTMKPDRPRFRRPRQSALDTSVAEDDEIVGAFNGYIAYCGRYTVDTDQGHITHRIECALFPDWVGTDRIRYFALLDGDLELRTPTVTLGDGADYTTVIRWRRCG